MSARLKVGDVVKYVPRMLADRDGPAIGTIDMIELAGYTFKIDMISITSVRHWIPMHECEKVNSGTV